MRVLKLGGSAQSDPRLACAIHAAWDFAPGALCIVHGGGDEITAMQNALGRQAVFHGGRRVTSKADLELLRMGRPGGGNKRLVNSLGGEGGPAGGIAGEDSGLVGAQRSHRA